MFSEISDPDRVMRHLATLAARCRSRREDARPPRALLRFAAAARRAFPELAEQALGLLAQDDRFAVRKAASTGLRGLLARLDGLARIRLVMEWTMSDQRRLRAAVARALRSALPVLGVVPALDMLAHDPYGDVRQAACGACALRVRHGGDAFAEILREASLDARRGVRRRANAALGGIAATEPIHHRAAQTRA